MHRRENTRARGRGRQPAAICFYVPLGYCTFDFELLRISGAHPANHTPLPTPSPLPSYTHCCWQPSKHFTCPIYCYFFLTKLTPRSSRKYFLIRF